MPEQIPTLEGFDVELPANPGAEKTILGAVFLENFLFYEAEELGLGPGDFSIDSHQRIWRRMMALMDGGHSVDIITMTNELAARQEIGTVGGVAYLASLTEGIPRRPVIREYVNIVKDRSMARQLMIASSQAIARAADRSETALEVGVAAIEAMEEIVSMVRRGGREMSAIVAEDSPRFEKEASAPANGVLGASLFTSGISKITCGIQEGELCLLCARPMQGKTEAAIQTVVVNARRGLRVHMHSLEMKAHQIARRMARYIAEVPVAAMRDPRNLKPEEKERLRRARAELATLPIMVDDTHELTISDYRSRCVLAAKRWKADLIVTDYAQLLLVPRAKNAVDEAKKQAETLRHIARDYCRTLALAQLRRAPPAFLDKFPDIEDILGSSAFEQAAQIILLLHRARKNKIYTGKDICFLGKIRELQSIQPMLIEAKPWGAFNDRDNVAPAPKQEDDDEGNF